MAPHRALEMVDILYQIFAHLPPEKDISKRLQSLLNLNLPPNYAQNRATLTRAACVCRAFSGPALTVLWREMDDILPLLQMFSSFQSVPAEKEPKVPIGTILESVVPKRSEQIWVLSGIPTEQEFGRFKKYAALIRTAACFRTDDIDPSVFLYLSHANHGQPLLPALRTLTFEQSACFEAGLLSLISPSLHSLNLLFGIASFLENKGRTTRRDHALRALLERICTGAPSLAHFHVSGWIRPSSLMPIATLKRLASVQLSFVHRLREDDSDLLRELSKLDSLTEVHIPHDLTITGTGKGFHDLQVLAIYGGLSNVSSLLSIVSSTHLRELTITASGLSEIEELPVALGSCANFASSLQSVTISAHPLIAETERTEEGEPQSIVFCLEPMLELRSLRKLWIHIGKKIACSDEDLKTMAHSWPKLVEFMLSHDSTGDIPSLCGVQALTRACKNLRAVNLPCVDPSPPWGDGDADGESDGVISHGLGLLSIERLTCLPKTELLVDVLDRCFPRLDVGCSKSFKMDFRELKKEDHPWVSVLEALGRRQDERAYGEESSGGDSEGSYKEAARKERALQSFDNVARLSCEAMLPVIVGQMHDVLAQI